MRGAMVSVNMATARIEATIRVVGKAVAQNGAENLIEKIRRNAPKRTGALANSFRYRPVTMARSTASTTVTSSLDYALYQEEGTGPIYPSKKGGVLVFTPKGSGVVVFARRTRGVPATHFVKKSADSMGTRDFALPRQPLRRL